MLDDEDRGRIIRCFEECWTKKGSAYYDALFYALRGVPTVAVLDGMKRYRAQQEGTYAPPIKDLARFCGGLVREEPKRAPKPESVPVTEEEHRRYARTASRLAPGKTPDAEDVRVLRELDLEYLIPPIAKEF